MTSVSPSGIASLLLDGQTAQAWAACHASPAQLAEALSICICSRSSSAWWRASESASSIAALIGKAMADETNSGSKPFTETASLWLDMGGPFFEALARGMGADREGPSAEAFVRTALALVPMGPRGSDMHLAKRLSSTPIIVPGLMRALVEREASAAEPSEFQLLAAVAVHGSVQALDLALAAAAQFGISAPDALLRGWDGLCLSGLPPLRLNVLACAILWNELPLIARASELAPSPSISEEAERIRAYFLEASKLASDDLSSLFNFIGEDARSAGEAAELSILMPIAAFNASKREAL